MAFSALVLGQKEGRWWEKSKMLNSNKIRNEVYVGVNDSNMTSLKILSTGYLAGETCKTPSRQAKRRVEDENLTVGGC